ncbi:MAG: DUF4105 domain-containing protein [Planctomycetota bacterium]
MARDAETNTPQRSLMARWAFAFGRIVLRILLLVYWAWAIGAAWHFTVVPQFARAVLAVLIFAVPLVVAIRTRNSRHRAIATLGMIIAMAVLWQFLRPSNDRNWKPELVNPPVVAFSPDRIEIDNFMAHEGPTKRSFDPRQINRVWFGVEKFAAWSGGAHNFLTFEFNDGKYVSVSVEARKEVGEEFGLLPAMFRQFELIYLIGDEARVFGARADFEAPMYLFPLKSSAEQSQALFIHMCERAHELGQQPEWYNVLTNNCTNNLAWHASQIAPRPISTYDMRVVLSGHSASLLYEMGLIDLEGALEEIEERCRVDGIGKELEIDSQFPQRIRQGIDQL